MYIHDTNVYSCYALLAITCAVYFMPPTEYFAFLSALACHVIKEGRRFKT